jgi:hypothetical protein
MGRFLPVCFYQQSMLSRQSAFGQAKDAAERQKLGGKRPFRKSTLFLGEEGPLTLVVA